MRPGPPLKTVGVTVEMGLLIHLLQCISGSTPRVFAVFRTRMLMIWFSNVQEKFKPFRIYYATRDV